MCTAVTYQNGHFYFGRTLDYEVHYGESVVFTPRRFPLPYRHLPESRGHFAMLGMAHVAKGYPLYYDAMNEHGLAMAGLNFVGFAAFGKPQANKDNVAVFEFIPWVLGQCEDLQQAKSLLGRLNLTDDAFSDALPSASLHWIIADRTGAVTVEATADGLHIYDNPLGVLTNSPTFPEHLFHLNDFMQLSAEEPENRFCPTLDLRQYSRGMGAIGLPGDLSSRSRFVRAAFGKLNSVSGESEAESVHQFFHILGTVAQIRGCCRLSDGSYEVTQYTSCCDTDAGVYYYTTYENSRIVGVDMHREDLDGRDLVSYPLLKAEPFLIQNEIQS
ncbi:MAG: choloylglycine hydrolase family protein [Ruminococcaceae bacterium]|nr:choloylglycine hydrolase family protein [Oscillospiraceae bacterium]